MGEFLILSGERCAGIAVACFGVVGLGSVLAVGAVATAVPADGAARATAGVVCFSTTSVVGESAFACASFSTASFEPTHFL